MNAPLIIYVTLVSFTLPLFAAASRRRTLDRPMRLVAAWYALLLVENAATVAWSYFVDRTNNLLLPQLFMPLEATLVLWALAEWQVHPVARRTVRLCLPVYWIVWSLAFAFIESPSTFSTFSGPVLGLLVLASALFGFVTRMQRDDEPVTETAWGWMLPGLAIFFAINATVTIVMAVGFADGDYQLMLRAGTLRAWIYLFATLLVTGGFLWPSRHSSSGASSSPLPSR